MVMCPKCGKMLEDGIRFCDNCGAQMPETVVCPNCGERTAAGFAFCQKCGAPLGQTPNPSTGYAPDPGAGYAPDPNAGYAPNPGTGYAPNPSTGYMPDPGAGYTPDPNLATATAQKKKVVPKKALIFGGIGVAAVAVVAAVIALIVNLVGGMGKNGNATNMFYLKDREIVYLDLKRDEPWEVTSRLLSGSMSDSSLAGNAYAFGMFIAINEDNSRIFYPDRTDFNSAKGVTLYYRSMKKTDEEPVKIDADISAYAINKAGTALIYLKGSDGGLYQHDLENKDKIASNVKAFDVADDCNTVLYLTEDNSVYLWTAGGDKTKLASDIASIQYVSDDLSVIYYTKLDSSDSYPYTYSLYKQAVGADDREKIASDISSVGMIYASGEMYYVKAENIEVDLMDYVDDNMAAADAVTVQPEWPIAYPEAPFKRNWNYDYWNDEYPWYYYADTNSWYGNDPVYVTQEEHDDWEAKYSADYADYQAECRRLDDEYQAADTAYWAKVSRDNLRESLKNNPIQRTQYTLYYYNGTEETMVTDALTENWEWENTYAADAATVLLRAYSPAEVTKAKITEINYYDEVRSMVRDALYSTTERYVAVQAVMILIDQPDASSFRIASDGSAIYFLDDFSDNHDKADLFRITVTNGQAGRPELYDSDVSTASMYFTSGNHFVYYKDVDTQNWKGDLYIDKTQIDYDVALSSVTYMGDAVLYYTDWKGGDRSYGTLKMYNNGEKTKIADDVHSFVLTPDNDILYLYDYSSSYKGTLYRYNQGKPAKIDDDVMALITVTGGYYKGYNYYW